MKVINVGSGMNMVHLNEWDTNGLTVVGVNNVWRSTDKWDHLIYAGDYPYVNEIKKNGRQQLHSRTQGKGFYTSYEKMTKMPFNEARVYLGMLMYFGAAYWSLYYMKPKHLGFIGFDMNYTPNDEGHTTHYGVGHDIKTRGNTRPLISA